jgi:hypothetical protein
MEGNAMKIRKVLLALGMACFLLAGTGAGLEAKGSPASTFKLYENCSR